MTRLSYALPWWTDHGDDQEDRRGFPDCSVWSLASGVLAWSAPALAPPPSSRAGCRVSVMCRIGYISGRPSSPINPALGDGDTPGVTARLRSHSHDHYRNHANMASLEDRAAIKVLTSANADLRVRVGT
jgi:hypothetical protein